MKFSGLTTASARLRAQSHRQELEKIAAYHAPLVGMTKEAWLGAALRAVPLVAKAAKNIGGKVVGGAARTAGRAASAPVRLPAKGLLNYAKRNPLQAGFAGLAVADAAGQARQVGKGYRAAQRGVQFEGQMSRASRHARRISPAHDIAPMSRF